MTALDCGTSHRAKALAYLRAGRVAVVHAVYNLGQLTNEATVRILPGDVGQLDRVVILEPDGTLTCSCRPAVEQRATAPGCPHVYAACMVLGRGGPR